MAWLSLAYFGKVRSKLPYLGIKFGVVSELSSLKHELGLAELPYLRIRFGVVSGTDREGLDLSLAELGLTNI